MRQQHRRSARAIIQVALLASLALMGRAHAQIFPYGQLEQVFGAPVTAAATGTPQLASDAPANVVIITQRQIRHSGAISIPGVLKYVVGLNVRPYTMTSPEIGVRTYNQPYNPRLLVLLNGRQVYLDDFGHVVWSSIPVQLSEIRQIEVIKGPATALYGFNAVDGVINIVTYDPLDDRVNRADVYGGTQSQYGASLVGTAHVGRMGIRLSAGSYLAEPKYSSALQRPDTVSLLKPQNEEVHLSTRTALSPGVSLYASLSYSYGKIPSETVAPIFSTLFLYTNSQRVELDADTRIGRISLNAYRNGLQANIAIPLFVLPNNLMQQRVYVLQATDLIRASRNHVIRLSLEYRNNAAHSLGFLGGTVRYQDIAADATWTWHLAPSVSLTNAVRVDDLWLGYDGVPIPTSGLTAQQIGHGGFTALSFNSGLVYKPTTVDTLRLLLGQGVQAPSLVDSGLQIGTGPLGLVGATGNPYLNPMIVDNAELDWTRELPALHSALHTALFIERDNNIISSPASGVIAPISSSSVILAAENTGWSEAGGGEISLKGHTRSGWRWSLGFAYEDTFARKIGNYHIAFASNSNLFSTVPRDSVVAHLGRTWGRFDFDAYGSWQSSYRDITLTTTMTPFVPVTIGSNFTFDARVAYHLTNHVTLSVVGQQLNAIRIASTPGPYTNRQVIVQLTARY
ncbi:MAG TPA: TonB-dependent receptor [Acidiphilium sp.]|uniref:TonB-dependent receptor plug domain-containing protein n=2 Tax=unclassified Acidiphilium TaxID=2617493 RepID=UPI0026D3EC87|nr:TonB-dependent receptor [Acidiphilium sp.]HQT59999.1 TonB-dependent receptor [Acidiphilium sp.]HQU11220.1 TonB-dependent receptor [Acidiphilium sp.]